MISRFAAGLILFATPVLADGGTEDGQLAFNNHCRTCHSVDAGDNRLGPTLNGIVGREAGAIEGYAFSDALARADFTWSEERLDAFIEDPDAVVRGNAMKPYGGLADEAVRTTIVDYLAGE